MATKNRAYIWMVCPVCNQRNYRTERYLNLRQKAVIKTKVISENNRLQLKKYCKKCKCHTLHLESRKK